METVEAGETSITRKELLQQRRILLGFTFAIAAKYALGITVANHATYAGMEFTVSKPELIIWAAWIAWVWSACRYWQYERTFRDQATTEARAREITERRMESIRLAIQEGVDGGLYRDRGFESVHSFQTSAVSGSSLSSARDSRQLG